MAAARQLCTALCRRVFAQHHGAVRHERLSPDGGKHRLLQDFQPLTEAEQAAVVQVRAIMHSQDSIACTACRYCTAGCPERSIFRHCLPATTPSRSTRTGTAKPTTKAPPCTEAKRATASAAAGARQSAPSTWRFAPCCKRLPPSLRRNDIAQGVCFDEASHAKRSGQDHCPGRTGP